MNHALRTCKISKVRYFNVCQKVCVCVCLTVKGTRVKRFVFSVDFRHFCPRVNVSFYGLNDIDTSKKHRNKNSIECILH